MCLLRPCRGWATGFAFWASGRRRRWQGEGSCCRQLCSEGSLGMIDGTASPAAPAMRHSWSWQPPGALFPLHPPHKEALIKTRGFPGSLLRHLGILPFFSPPFFLAGCEPQWNSKKAEIKSKARVLKGVLLLSLPSQNPYFVGFGKLRFLLLFLLALIPSRCIYRMPSVPMYQPDVVQSPNQQLTAVHCMDGLIVCIMGRAQLL